MRSLNNFSLALIACSFWGAVPPTVHAQLSESVNECGNLERKTAQSIPLSKRERITQRQEEITDLVDQVETCTEQNGQGASSGGSSDRGSSQGSNGQGFNNTLEEGENSVASNILKGSKIPAIEAKQEPAAGKAEDSYALESGTQEPASGNGANQEALKKVDNNERLRRQLEAKIASEKDPSVKAALEKKLNDLKK